MTSRVATHRPAAAPVSVERGVAEARGRGRPLSDRAGWEARLGGADLSRVSVHADGRAGQMASALGASAFTVGQDLFFAPGRYAPDTTPGRSLLAHELAHTQQPLAHARLRARWDPAPAECPSSETGRWLERVVVEQETPQSVTLHWSDGTIESGIASAGKGHCCVDPATPGATACDFAESRRNGSNCTPISRDTGWPVLNRQADHNGVLWWTEIDATRSIALHEYSPVDGTPLSHGCVRLNHDIAVKVFCGARQNQTMVQIRGFARPRCDHPELQNEWLGDFFTAGAEIRDGDPEGARQIREERRALNEAFGRTLSVSEIRGLEVEDIPRCGATAPRPTVEEQRVTAEDQTPGQAPSSGFPNPAGTTANQILATSGFASLLTPFLSALSGATTLSRARTAVNTHGDTLWQTATRRAQAATPDTDDRPLYWARLEATRAIRQWAPRFTLSDADRLDLIDRFERASRGMSTATFGAAPDQRRVLISGFDPFGLDSASTIARGNPSGAAVLALDGRTLTAGGVSAEIQGVIFPVRFADFDAGLVERFFGPYLGNPPSVHMVMTISQGGSSDFEVEQWAGRRRSSAATDNLGQRGGGTPSAPVVPAGVTAGDEFIETTLPAAGIRSHLGRTSPLPGETEIDEIPAGGSSAVNRPTGGPTAGSTSVEGSGGGYLSNEIFYRTSAMRVANGLTLPMGHLHTPLLDPPSSATGDTAFTAARDAIVTSVEAILRSVIPTL